MYKNSYTKYSPDTSFKDGSIATNKIGCAPFKGVFINIHVNKSASNLPK